MGSHSLAAKMEGSLLLGGAEIRGKSGRQTACQLLRRDCQKCYSGDCEPGKRFLEQFQAENELLLRGGGWVERRPYCIDSSCDGATGSLEHFQSTVLSSSGILLCIRGTVLCGCGRIFYSLKEVQKHLEDSHGKLEDEGNNDLVDLKNTFESSFVFPSKDRAVKEEEEVEEDDVKRNYVQDPQVVRVILPSSFMCVCLNEHDIGA